jgi:hypothetical protein
MTSPPDAFFECVGFQTNVLVIQGTVMAASGAIPHVTFRDWSMSAGDATSASNSRAASRTAAASDGCAALKKPVAVDAVAGFFVFAGGAA